MDSRKRGPNRVRFSGLGFNGEQWAQLLYELPRERFRAVRRTLTVRLLIGSLYAFRGLRVHARSLHVHLSAHLSNYNGDQISRSQRACHTGKVGLVIPIQ